MRRCIRQYQSFPVVPDILLNDAVTIPQMAISQRPIIKGDAKSVSIAAASIFAKVTRDRMMLAYDALFPEYGFAANKGYGTKEHIAAGYKNTVRHRFIAEVLSRILFDGDEQRWIKER